MRGYRRIEDKMTGLVIYVELSPHVEDTVGMSRSRIKSADDEVIREKVREQH